MAEWASAHRDTWKVIDKGRKSRGDSFSDRWMNDVQQGSSVQDSGSRR